jgi:hypothetical protein
MNRRDFLVSLLVACAHGPTVPAVDPSRPPSSAWMTRAIDETKDIVITADLRALLADDVFAPATRRAMRAASDRAVPSANLKDAWDGARAAKVVLLEGGTILLLLSEVPDLDPTSLTGWDGTWQWKHAVESPPGTLECAFIPEAGSLFVLGDHSWVLGAGASAQRARSALLEARGHPVTKIDLAHPIEMSLPASRMALVVRRIRIRELEPALDGIRMLHVAATLGANPTVEVTLDYDSEAGAARAEPVLARVFQALASKDGEPLAFLSGSRLVRDGVRLRTTAVLPPAVLESLSRAEDRLF